MKTNFYCVFFWEKYSEGISRIARKKALQFSYKQFFLTFKYFKMRVPVLII